MSAQRGGVRATIEQTHVRNLRIVELRGEGKTWPAIAAEVGVNERTCRRAFADYSAVMAEDGGFDVLTVEALVQLDVALEHAWRTFHSARAKDTHGRVGALRLVTTIGKAKLAFVAASGRMREPLRDIEAERAKLHRLLDEAARLLLDGMDLAGTDPEEREQMLAEYGLSDIQPSGEHDVMRNPSWLRTDTSQDPSPMLEQMRREHPERFDNGGGER